MRKHKTIIGLTAALVLVSGTAWADNSCLSNNNSACVTGDSAKMAQAANIQPIQSVINAGQSTSTSTSTPKSKTKSTPPAITPIAGSGSLKSTGLQSSTSSNLQDSIKPVAGLQPITPSPVPKPTPTPPAPAPTPINIYAPPSPTPSTPSNTQGQTQSAQTPQPLIVPQAGLNPNQ